MPLQKEIDTMLAAAQKAGDIALRHFSTGTAVEEKADLSPVTAADRDCEQAILETITAAFPLDGILGEEGASQSSRSGRRWLIDPIDGTRDFVRGNSFWSVQIALESEGRVIMGVIRFPMLGQTLHAVIGHGCYWNNNPVRHPGESRLDKAILMISGLKNAWEVWPAESVRLLTERCWTVRSYGASYDVAMLARGKADIWLSGNGMEWDYAAAHVIARECGARFLVKDGTGRIDARHCLLCPPGLERELKQILHMQ